LKNFSSSRLRWLIRDRFSELSEKLIFPVARAHYKRIFLNTKAIQAFRKWRLVYCCSCADKKIYLFFRLGKCYRAIKLTLILPFLDKHSRDEATGNRHALTAWILLTICVIKYTFKVAFVWDYEALANTQICCVLDLGFGFSSHTKILANFVCFFNENIEADARVCGYWRHDGLRKRFHDKINEF
jgi:hypothetical protein